MKRALQLSLLGGPLVSPNPFVGAVIFARGRIIGEGYHRRFGGPHAEVNAVNSVSSADRILLGESTMYVTLEPCSHFGKTPPCADLVVCSGIPRVVIAAEDPFLKDYESGIDKLRAAGVEVETGFMRAEARWINRRFFTAHTLKRPFILLKWAQSADGYVASGGRAVKLSTPFTSVLMHRERALYDAIMVGTDTVLIDNPRLNSRYWPSRNPGERPLKLTFGSRRLEGVEGFVKKPESENLSDFLHRLYTDHKIISLMVEGGPATINSFIKEGLYDEIRIETSPRNLGEGAAAPDISRLHLPRISSNENGGSIIQYYSVPGVPSLNR